MTDNKINLFLITKGLNNIRAINSFISINYDTARMQFHDYIRNMQEKHTYKLYKIAEIDKNLKLTECKYFICAGWSSPKEKAYQKKFDIFNEKKMIEAIAENAIKKPTKQIIKEFFLEKEITEEKKCNQCIYYKPIYEINHKFADIKEDIEYNYCDLYVKVKNNSANTCKFYTEKGNKKNGNK